MKHFVIFFVCQCVIFVFPLSQILAAEPPAADAQQQDQYDWGRRNGRMAAEETPGDGGKWFGNGFIGGCLLGPVGTAIAAVASQRGMRYVPDGAAYRLPEHSPAYQRGFTDAYVHGKEKRALTNSLAGGLVGTLVLGMAFGIVYGSMVAADLHGM